MDNNAFGKFIKEKRQQNELSLRALAKQVELSHIYLYNIENGIKAPPNDIVLKRLAIALNLDEKNQLIFFDTAAKCKFDTDSTNYYIPVDISQYLNENEDVRNVIREANQKEQHKSFWNELLKELKE